MPRLEFFGPTKKPLASVGWSPACSADGGTRMVTIRTEASRQLPASGAQAPGSAHGLLYDFLTADHAYMDSLLERASSSAAEVAAAAYEEFRRRLLKHIGMEEKILWPAAQRRSGGEPLAGTARLRLDHGALAALLMLTPKPATLRALHAVLSPHNALEEASDGVYATCERLTAAEADELLTRLRAAPEVPVATRVSTDDPKVIAAVRRALVRAGYDQALLDEK